MNLEIVITENLIRIHADWFWYFAIVIWLLFAIVSKCLDIQKWFLERKLKKEKSK